MYLATKRIQYITVQPLFNSNSIGSLSMRNLSRCRKTSALGQLGATRSSSNRFDQNDTSPRGLPTNHVSTSLGGAREGVGGLNLRPNPELSSWENLDNESSLGQFDCRCVATYTAQHSHRTRLGSADCMMVINDIQLENMGKHNSAPVFF